MVAKKKTRADILAEANKKYKDSFTVGFQSNAEFLDTGNLTLNHLIGGGVPRGRITQFYGQSMSGKTTAALQTAAKTQKKIYDNNLAGQYILYMDYECALDEDYAKALGLDIKDEDTFLMLRPDYFENGANMARDFIESGEVHLAIWDSVPSMIPLTVTEEEVGKPLVAPLPRVLAPFLGQLNPLLNKTKTAAIFINHVGDKIGGMPGFGPPTKVRPGGKALTYYSSVMVEFTGTTKEKGKVYNAFGEEIEVPIATLTKMTCTKNKVGVPMREAQALVRYGEGFDNFWVARRFFESKGLIVKSGAWVKVDESLGGGNFNGMPALQRHAEANPEWRENIITLAATQLELEKDMNFKEAAKATKLFPTDDPASIVDELS